MQVKLNDYIKAMNDQKALLQKKELVRSQLLQQLTENQAVASELETVTEEDKIFKLVGPLLVRQTVDDATEHVQQRVSFIQARITEVEKESAAITERMASIKDDVEALQKVAQKKIADTKAKLGMNPAPGSR